MDIKQLWKSVALTKARKINIFTNDNDRESNRSSVQSEEAPLGKKIVNKNLKINPVDESVNIISQPPNSG